jgi:hypothetical protein
MLRFIICLYILFTFLGLNLNASVIEQDERGFPIHWLTDFGDFQQIHDEMARKEFGHCCYVDEEALIKQKGQALKTNYALFTMEIRQNGQSTFLDTSPYNDEIFESGFLYDFFTTPDICHKCHLDKEESELKELKTKKDKILRARDSFFKALEKSKEDDCLSEDESHVINNLSKNKKTKKIIEIEKNIGVKNNIYNYFWLLCKLSG